MKKYVPRSIQNIHDRTEARNESIQDKLFSEELATTFEVIIYTSLSPEVQTPIINGCNSSNNSKVYFCSARSKAGHHDHLVLPEKAKTRDEYEKFRNAHFQAVTKKSGDIIPTLGDVWTATYNGGNLVTLISLQREGIIITNFKEDGPAKNAHSSSEEPTVLNGDYLSSDTSAPPPRGEAVVIQGSVWPYDPIKNNKKISLTKEMKEEYIPTRDSILSNEPLGLRLLITAMAVKEGFYAINKGENYRGKMYEPSTGKTGTRSYRFNNPGNIGNTDEGKNVPFPTLGAGIKAQADYVKKVASGKHKAYPLGKKKNLKPYYSKEIAENQESYGNKSPTLPGYQFTYTGQLDQFVKIYATSSRSSNTYMSTIISYFNENGIKITNESKIQDIINMN